MWVYLDSGVSETAIEFVGERFYTVNMKTYRDGAMMFVVMEKGERITQDIRELAAMPSVPWAATVVTALGLLKNIEVGFGSYERQTVSYDRETLAGPLEFLALSGFVLKHEAQPFHFHAVFGDKDKAVFGGHLFDAEVVTFVEMTLLFSNAPIRRVLKEGLPKMSFGDSEGSEARG